MEPKEWDNYSKEYHDAVVSPLKDSVSNPLFSDINKIKDKGQKTIADIGTGRGDALKHLKGFKSVYALDFSKEMVAEARKRNEFSNVVYKVWDNRKLSKLKVKFDLVLAINSILHPNFKDVDKSLSEIKKSLKKSGVFIGIFPSMEAVLYNSMLVLERECKDRHCSRAVKRAKKIIERNKYDFIQCIYDDCGEKQKFFYQFELEYRLKRAGFSKISFEKVLYHWDKTDYESFHGMPEMWDWYVFAS